jgi:hypothetical protein
MKTKNLRHRTLGLATVGAVSIASVVQAEEKLSTLGTALSSTVISGYVDTSAQWNFGTGNANNPGYLFGGPGKADGFNLNVVKLMLERPSDLTDGWGAGYKVDLLFGPDANAYATQSVPGTTPDVAVKQAYVSLKAPLGNGLEFKVGVWDTILGYEVFETTINPNFTRSYGYSIEPATFTGILAMYNVTELIAIAGGVANTLASTINSRAFPTRAESYKAYMGDISLTAPASWGWAGGSTLYAAVVNGFNPVSAATGLRPADQTSFYAGTTVNTPLKALKVGLAYDYAGVSRQAISGSGYANALGLYALFQATEKISVNTRAEWFTQSPANAVGGLPSKVLALTGTVQYDLWKNAITRLEFRWDHSADGTVAYGGTTAGFPTQKNAYELIANLIYKF